MLFVFLLPLMLVNEDYNKPCLKKQCIFVSIRTSSNFH